MSGYIEKDRLDEILEGYYIWMADTFNQSIRSTGFVEIIGTGDAKPLKPTECRENIEELILSKQREALYGFHKYIVGKNIIKIENDQTFNYARIHRSLDDYISLLSN